MPLRLPKLSPGTSLEPYVRQDDEIAAIDPAHLVDPKHKILSDSLRSVATKQPSKVSEHLPLSISSPPPQLL